MAPTTSKPAVKRKAPAFKPPRPKASKSSKNTSITKGQSNPGHRPSVALQKRRLQEGAGEDTESEVNESGDSDDDDMDEPSRASPISNGASGEDEPASTQDVPPSIPPALLTKLLHHHFQDDQTRIGMEARGVVGKYMETFVREAIARAAFERQSGEKGTRGVIGDDFLEVMDLEKLAPQLLLDF